MHYQNYVPSANGFHYKSSGTFRDRHFKITITQKCILCLDNVITNSVY